MQYVQKKFAISESHYNEGPLYYFKVKQPHWIHLLSVYVEPHIFSVTKATWSHLKKDSKQL